MKAPKGRDEPVLYLDYDGALHHDACFWHPRRGTYLQAGPGYSLFQHEQLLDELLAPYPDVLIVPSTSWVRIYRCAGAANRLPAGLRSRVIEATPSQLSRASSSRPVGQLCLKPLIAARSSGRKGTPRALGLGERHASLEH